MARAFAVAGRLVVLLAACLSAACSGRQAQSRNAWIFSSNVVVTLRDHASEATFSACFERLREIDAELSMWQPASGLSRLNAAAGEGQRPVSADLAAAAAEGLELARLTEGIFDPTVGPLTRLWGIGGPSPRLPSEAERSAARALVGWRRVRLDPSARAIELERGMALDFGALAKGYGAMEGARLLADRGVRSGLLDVGGCVVAIGSGARGQAWRIGIQDPRAPRGAPLGYVSVRDAMVDTSGLYERYFEKDGRRYPHIFDTRTGMPVEGGIVSATAVLSRGRNADGPPLAFLVLGPREGIALADRLGMPAILVDSRNRIYLSKAAKGIFTLTGDSYAIAPQNK